MSTQNYDATNPRAVPLTRGKQEAVAIANGANNDTDVYCGGDSKLVVMCQMTGGALGDIGLTVLPFEADNNTVMLTALAPVRAPANIFSGGKVYAEAEYDVAAFEKVRIRITNNNAAPQTIDRASWRLA
jgi:hypothetical protein